MCEDYFSQTESFIFVEDQPQQADIIFVPGNGYPQMAERAAELYREGYAPWVLPSGKYSIMAGKFTGVLDQNQKYPGEYETEWEFLKTVLIKNGVPEEAILREDQATFTWENAKLSRKVTDAAYIQVKRAILCCKTYHARRALMYYQMAYPEAEFFVCPASPDQITRDNWRETEAGVDAVAGEVTRIMKQKLCLMK
jgi:uncharacterized SAM-binding protein YcdF (DUF218 family)